MSLQSVIARTLLKLPDSWLVRLSGGKPVEIGGRTLDPHTQFIARGAASQPPMSSMQPKEARAGSSAGLAMLADKPVPGVKARDFTVPSRDTHEIPARLYTPQNQDPKAPLMVYFHFGGGVIGDLETCHVFCTMLAAEVGCPVLSVDYRLAPEHKFPAGYEDCVDAYHWALDHASDLGAPAGKAAIGGDSMGGNFTAALSLEAKLSGKPMPVMQLLVYPATDLVTEFPSATTYGETYPLSSDTMVWFMGHYLPEGTDRADARISPALVEDMSGLPPSVVATAGFDPLVDDGAAYAEKLKAAGVPVSFKCYDSLAHGFTAMTGASPASRAACQEIAGMVAKTYESL